MIKISIKSNPYIYSVMMACVSLSGSAASGVEVYKSTCATCHDSGAGRAPRLTHRDEWQPRWQRGREAMYVAAIQGLPNTAMVARGGFSKLSDAEVKAAVDYILARTGYRDDLVVKRAAPPAVVAVAPRSGAFATDDQTLLKQVAEALRNGVAPPGAQIEAVDGQLLIRGVYIRVGVRDGVVTLQGILENAKLVPQVEQIAKSVRGARRVDNKLVGAGMMDWD